MSEITSDYYDDADVNRWLVTAKTAQLSGTGDQTSHPWVITGAELPDELLDSDLSTADASGAPTLRASTDEFGLVQLNLHIVDFTPASGGSGGSATAEIYLNAITADHTNGQPVYLWWGKSGKTQPAASAEYGSEGVYNSTFGAAYQTEDGADATANANDGSLTNVTGSTNVPFGSEDSMDFASGRSEITDDDSLDMTDKVTVMCWFYADTDTGTFQGLVGKRSSFTIANYSLAFNEPSNMSWQLVSGSLKGIDADFTTHFGLTEWFHIACTFEDTGADIAAEIFSNAVSVSTGTLTSSSLIANSTIVTLGNINQSSFGFPLDGQMKAIWIINDVLTDDQITTVYNNQNAPGTFWDTTEAVVAGPFSSEDTPQYSWTFNGRERQWDVEFFTDGFIGATTVLCAGAEMTGRWGFNTGTFDERIRAAELRLEVVDPDLVLYNTLVDTTKTESDFKLKLTDSTGTYILRMRVRLDEVATMLVAGLEEQVTSLYAYCSMADLANIDAVILSSSTIHNLFRLILVSSGIGQNIEYYIAHHAENMSASGALLDFQRLNRLDLIFAEEGRKIDSMYDQLRSMLEGFGAVAINGLDGQWHVKHEYSLGEVKTDRGAQSYDFVAGSLSTGSITQTTKTLTDDILSRNTIKTPLPPVQAVQVDRGNGRDFFSVDVVKHGDFEYGWVSATESEVWETNQGTGIARSTNSDTGVYSGVLASGSNQVTQSLVRMAGGYQDIDVEVAIRYALESINANNTKTGTAFLNLRFFNPTTVDLTNGDPGGDWTTDPINGAISLDAAVVTSGSSLVWTTLITTVYGPLPDYDGELGIRINSSVAEFQSYFDTFEVRLKRGDNAKMDFRAVSGRYDLSGNLIGSGGIVQQRVPWYNGLLGLDPGDDGTRDSVHPMVQVLTTTLGSWIQASQFKSLVSGFTTDEYDDLFNLTSAIRIARQSETASQIEGEVCEIVPHEMPMLYDGKRYVQQYTEIDFKREVTRFVANEKINVGVSGADSATKIFFVGEDDDKFYTFDQDFTNETDTGLDLTSQGIIDIDRHQGTSMIYGLGTSGTVYKWADDGSGSVSTVVATGFSDMESIHVDNVNNYIFVGYHLASASNNRFYVYDLDGNAIKNIEARKGASSYTGNPCQVATFSGVTYLYDYHGTGLARFRLSDGLAESLQGVSGSQYAAGIVDDVNHIGFQVIGSAIYQYNPTTVNNPSSAVLVANNAPTVSTFCDWFDDGTDRYMVGTKGGKMWSWRVGTALVVQDQTVANVRTLCTIHDYGT